MAEVSTIAALATAPAPAGIAVIRVSGPKTRTVLKALFRAKHDPTSDPRRLTFGSIIDHQSGQVIDQALAVYMPGPHSYTGEDVGEFQFHGSPVLVQKILRSLFAFGISPAEPGEFTKRAFLNGKVDLVQAESVCDLINAASEQALRLASEHLKGRFSEAIAEIGEPLRNTLAEIEAHIDFPDEDIQPQKVEQLAQTLVTARQKIAAILKTYSYGQVVREGYRVLLCGRPNVGKSSILNLLLDRERAIVTEISGTTRDIIEEEAIIGGYRFIFCDSAGITESNDKVEQKGIELTRSRVPWADLVLFVADANDQPEHWQAVLSELRGTAKKIWMVTNKIDLNPQAFTTHFCDSSICAQNFYLSAKTRNGLEALVQSLMEEVRLSVGDRAQASNVVTNERHRNCLNNADEALSRAIDAAKRKLPLEIASAEIRIALNALEEIVGKTATEDILGRIFSRFCIGK
jgi:tRNA modification GTPase